MLLLIVTIVEYYCIVSEISRIDDYNTKLLEGIEADDFYTLRDSDFAAVRCKSKKGNTLVNFLIY